MSDINSEVSDTTQLLQITAAHKVAKNTQKFHEWATSVNLDPEPLDGESLPEFLRQQVEDSRLVPSWILNANAPEFKSARRFFSQNITEFTDQVKAFGQLLPCPSPDQDLSDELEGALLDIFRMVSQHLYFPLFVTRPTETDRRRPIDNLHDHIWQLEGGTSFLHRMECPVQLPQPADHLFCAARADSAVFIHPNYSVSLLKKTHFQSWCSITNPDTYTHVLHWANEFKRESNEMTSKRQAWMAMVSGLYQRRALGFSNHYVYGTAHHSETQLTIYAGAWDGKGSQGGKLSKDAKIMLYELCTFDTISSVDMVQFYLLMRLSRQLALEYKASLEEINFSRLLIQKQADKGLGFWPPPPDPRRDSKKSKSSKKSSKRPRLSEVAEEPHDSVDLSDLSDCSMTEPNSPQSPDVKNIGQSVPVVHVNDSLKHQFADVLSRKGEWSVVHGYLASSQHKRYDYQVEPISEQVGGDSACACGNSIRDV